MIRAMPHHLGEQLWRQRESFHLMRFCVERIVLRDQRDGIYYVRDFHRLKEHGRALLLD